MSAFPRSIPGPRMSDFRLGRPELLTVLLIAFGFVSVYVAVQRPLLAIEGLCALAFLAVAVRAPLLGLAGLFALTFLGTLVDQVAGGSFSPGLWAAKGAGGALVLVWIFTSLSRRELGLGVPVVRLFVGVALALLIWSFCSALWAADPSISASAAARLGQGPLLMIVIVAFVRTTSALALLCYTFIGGATLSAAAGLSGLIRELAGQRSAQRRRGRPELHRCRPDAGDFARPLHGADAGTQPPLPRDPARDLRPVCDRRLPDTVPRRRHCSGRRVRARRGLRRPRARSDPRRLACRGVGGGHLPRAPRATSCSRADLRYPRRRRDRENRSVGDRDAGLQGASCQRHRTRKLPGCLPELRRLDRHRSSSSRRRRLAARPCPQHLPRAGDGARDRWILLFLALLGVVLEQPGAGFSAPSGEARNCWSCSGGVSSWERLEC